MRIDGEVRPVRIKVENVVNKNRSLGYYYHQLDEVSVEEPVGSTPKLPAGEQGIAGTSSDEISVAKKIRAYYDTQPAETGGCGSVGSKQMA